MMFKQFSYTKITINVIGNVRFYCCYKSCAFRNLNTLHRHRVDEPRRNRERSHATSPGSFLRALAQKRHCNHYHTKTIDKHTVNNIQGNPDTNLAVGRNPLKLTISWPWTPTSGLTCKIRTNSSGVAPSISTEL